MSINETDEINGECPIDEAYLYGIRNKGDELGTDELTVRLAKDNRLLHRKLEAMRDMFYSEKYHHAHQLMWLIMAYMPQRKMEAKLDAIRKELKDAQLKLDIAKKEKDVLDNQLRIEREKVEVLQSAQLPREKPFRFAGERDGDPVVHKPRFVGGSYAKKVRMRM